ncbi:MAG TPA: hypothetical protein VIK40_09015, partial [Geomonas sp.]
PKQTRRSFLPIEWNNTLARPAEALGASADFNFQVRPHAFPLPGNQLLLWANYRYQINLPGIKNGQVCDQGE